MGNYLHSEKFKIIQAVLYPFQSREFERNLFLFIIVFLFLCFLCFVGLGYHDFMCFFVVFLFYGGFGFFCLISFVFVSFLFYVLWHFLFWGILCMFCAQQIHIDALFCYCYHMFLCIVFGFLFFISTRFRCS